MAVHRPPTKLDKLASRQPNFRPGAPSPPPDSVPAFSPTARRLPLHRAEVTDVFYTPTVPRPNSPAIFVKSNTPDSSRLSRRGTRIQTKRPRRHVAQASFHPCRTGVPPVIVPSRGSAAIKERGRLAHIVPPHVGRASFACGMRSLFPQARPSSAQLEGDAP